MEGTWTVPAARRRPARGGRPCFRAGVALLAAVLACAGLAASAEAETDTAAVGIHKIQHVVILMQENRSFDTYFGTYPGAEGIPPGVCVPDTLHPGTCARPYYNPEQKNKGGVHNDIAAKADIDEDAYLREAQKGCTPKLARCFPCTEAHTHECIDVMGYHDARQIPNYWSYAEHYVLQDRMFESSSGNSLPEHMYLISAWSAICGKKCFGSTHPNKPADAKYPWTDITYLLHKNGVSWGYYLFEGREPDCESDEELECIPPKQASTTAGIWNPLRDFTDVAEDDQLSNIQSIARFYENVHQTSSCGLPDVSWVIPSFIVSEHPNDNLPGGTIAQGQAYVTTLINSIMRSPCWDSTAIFLSWDDWGGFYDNVTPPQIDENGYGLRVPGLVISPYAKTGFIDHQTLSHDAYLKFIEDDFMEGQRLNPLTDGRPDARPDVREELTGELTDDFEFEQPPRPPMLLSPRPKPGPASTPP
jgi:phospholipase C